MIRTSVVPIFYLCVAAFTLVACGKPIDVVEAGTYKGTINKVVPEEEEIYVTLASGERLELYFDEATELVRDGEPVEFSTISEGDPVAITVAREGNRNTPVRVELL